MEYQPTDPSTPSKFSDVPDDSQWLPYIDAAEKSGLIKGYLDGTFRPENCVNRIEAMKLAYIAMVPNTVSLETPPSLLTYDGKPITDMNPMYWYGSIADYMFKNRLVDSTQTLHDPEKYSEDFEAIKFFPEGSMTRKEAAHMMWEIARTHYPDRYLRWCSGWMKENFQLFHSDPESK